MESSLGVLVTGAGGFLGGRITTALAQRGQPVVALMRDPTKAVRRELPNVRLAAGDLLDRASLKSALQGCRQVVHCAALVKNWAPDPRVFDRVNVDGLRNVLEESAAAGVERIVYTSSFMALGPSDGRPVDESAPLERDHVHNDYERTKHRARIVAVREAARGLPLITLYPGVIYGPGALTDGNIVVQRILEVARGRLPGVLGDGRREWSYSYVDDVVDGHLAALDRGRLGAEYVLGGENVSMNRFLELLVEIGGLRPVRRHIPFFIARQAAWCQQTWAGWRGRQPPLTVAEVRIFEHAWALESDRARRELGYAPRPLADGLRLTIAWLREQGLLPAP